MDLKPIVDVLNHMLPGMSSKHKLCFTGIAGLVVGVLGIVYLGTRDDANQVDLPLNHDEPSAIAEES